MKAENSIYKTVSGVNLPIRIYYPEKPNGNCVVNIHGGGWRAIKSNEEWNGGWMDYQAQYYAERGYIGIVFSYRSIDISDDTEITDLYTDCRDAMKYIKSNVKYDKLVITGDSAGGHLASLLSFDPDIHAELAVLCNPVLDITAEPWTMLSKNPEVLRKYSPYFNIKPTNTKYLLMHGEADAVVSCDITKSFFEMLSEKGIYAELVTLPNVNHAFILKNYRSTDEQLQEYMNKIDSFIKRNI